MKLFTLMLLGFFLTLSTSAFDIPNIIKPFSTDGCSMSPDGTIEKPLAFLSCCIEHDIAYWQGGSSKLRKKADKKFYSCMKEVAAKPIAYSYYKAVRVNGGPYQLAPYRWAYGWPVGMGYRDLNDEQNQSVAQESMEIERISQEFRDAQEECLKMESGYDKQKCILKMYPIGP